MATTTTLMTADEFLKLDDGCLSELVRGKVIFMNRPGYRHGMICNTIAFFLTEYSRSHDLGRVIINDAGVVTERDPDSVRGPDVAFYGYRRVAKGTAPVGYPSVPPDFVFEVLSPDDRASYVLQKVAEYLNAGVTAVYVVDPRTKQVNLYRENQPMETFAEGGILSLPEPLHDLQIDVSTLFE